MAILFRKLLIHGRASILCPPRHENPLYILGIFSISNTLAIVDGFEMGAYGLPGSINRGGFAYCASAVANRQMPKTLDMTFVRARR